MKASHAVNWAVAGLKVVLGLEGDGGFDGGTVSGTAAFCLTYWNVFVSQR